MRMQLTALAFVVFMLLSCGRTADLLHYQKEEPPKILSMEHKLKELQAESKVDILWVIDNSASMGDYHSNLIRNMDLFLDEFEKIHLEWKMGLISTTVGAPPYIGFTSSTQLTFQTPDGLNVFRQAVARLGTNGAGYEKTFDPLVETLKKYPDFTRPKAVLAVIVVTDAQEQSDTYSFQDALDQLQILKGTLRRSVGYGVFGPTDFGCDISNGEEKWKYAGSTYESFMKELNGKTYPLCSADFGKNLADMGKDLVKHAQHPRIYLNERPIPESINIFYKDKKIQGGPEADGGHWTYNFELNLIEFSDTNFAPEDNEVVRVEFIPA